MRKVGLLEVKKIFERNRIPLKVRALGILLYHLGLSLQNCSMVLTSFTPVSHETVRLWYHRSYRLFSVNKQYQEMIAVDETKIKINGRQHLLWAAIDINTWEVLGVWITQGRCSLEAYSFLKQVLKKCDNDPKILVDGIHQHSIITCRLGTCSLWITKSNRAMVRYPQASNTIVL